VSRYVTLLIPRNSSSEANSRQDGQDPQTVLSPESVACSHDNISGLYPRTFPLTQNINTVLLAGVAQTVQGLATGWTVRGSNPGGARFSAPVQTDSGEQPAYSTMGTGFLSVGKTAGTWRKPPTLFSV